ncbi:glycosyltransferase family 4 protein [Hyphococcus luteus]|uniref:Glycosyl transferase n=1 Tax=Hyphococcus luteus TaxID=2058213 RepID=A0A2S7K5R1_9PROT|nr:glycosyl transferase [Marinicaulis flavus]PQA87816.1 glycosyl transferase [Marinicaulis flavus]
MIEPFIMAVAAAMTVAVVYCVSMLAARAGAFLDEPNERSSHDHATPRIGGAAITGGWVVGLFVMAAFADDGGAAKTLALIGVAGVAAFFVGLADDKLGLSPVWKFGGQILVAALFIFFFGALQSAPLPSLGAVALGPLWGAALTVFWIVGFMNAFNFMDGANGLAAGAAAAGLAWFAVFAGLSGAPVLAVAALLLACAAAGFLPENLIRGKIFMGDNGSQMLGFLIAAFAVLGANWTEARLSVLVMPVIFLPFIFDVAWTLFSRALRKQNLLAAHREHLYQLMMRGGFSHASVAVIYMGLVSLCAGAGALMLAMPPSLQWLAPLALSFVFIVGAARITARADKSGLLKRRAAADDDALQPAAE